MVILNADVHRGEKINATTFTFEKNRTNYKLPITYYQHLIRSAQIATRRFSISIP